MLDKYIAYISGIRRYSKRTCEIYHGILEDFHEFSAIASPAGITPAAVRNYEVELLDARGQSARSVNLALSVLSGYCRYLVREGELESNPVRLVKRPKNEKRLPDFYRDESIKE